MSNNLNITPSISAVYNNVVSAASICNTPYSIVGDIAVTSDTNWISSSWIGSTASTTIGIINDDTKQNIYIVDEWQSSNPIKIEDGLYISFEKDLLSNSKLKEKIFDKLSETHPDIVLKMGMNKDNMTLRKSTVSLEINKED